MCVVSKGRPPTVPQFCRSTWPCPYIPFICEAQTCFLINQCQGCTKSPSTSRTGSQLQARGCEQKGKSSRSCCNLAGIHDIADYHQRRRYQDNTSEAICLSEANLVNMPTRLTLNPYLPWSVWQVVCRLLARVPGSEFNHATHRSSRRRPTYQHDRAKGDTAATIPMTPSQALVRALLACLAGKPGALVLLV